MISRPNMVGRAIELPDSAALEISLRDLRSVAAIAQEGSLTAAAARLGFSQGTVSAHLAAAEAALGVALFHRNGRGVVPTDAGRSVLRHASVLFATLGSLRKEARGTPRPTFTIGACEPAASRRIIPFIRSVERDGSELEVTLRVGTSAEVHELVERGEVEVGVTGTRPRASQVTKFTRMYDQELVLLVPERHRLASARRADLLELAGERLLVGDDTCLYRRIVEQTLRRADVDVALRARVGAIATLPLAVASGLGIAIVPSELVNPPPRRTVIVPLREPILFTIGVLLRSDATERARRIAAEIRSYLAPSLGKSASAR